MSNDDIASSQHELATREIERLEAQIAFNRAVLGELTDLGIPLETANRLIESRPSEMEGALAAGSRPASIAELLAEFKDSEDISERVRKYIISQNALNKQHREEYSPYRVLHGHDSPLTAYVVHDYPYGRFVRCMMRHWIEYATKGVGKGKFRHMAQTTGKAWNHHYSILLREAKLIPEQDHLPATPSKFRPTQDIFDWMEKADWNNPKKSNYYDFIFLYLDERNFVSTGTIDYYASPDRWVAFRNMWQINMPQCQFTEDQINMLSMLENASRKHACTSSWQEYEAEHGAVPLINNILKKEKT